MYIRKHIEETSELDYEPVSLNPFLESGLIKLLFLETEEEKNLFIELAANLDDGESATIALAIERQMNIVTEDRKAIRIFNERKSANVCTTTLDLIKEWQKKEGIDRKTIQTVLKNIVEFGSYKPGRNHHLFDWWNEMIRIK
ncbi:MAG: hypothetical protein GWN00_11855 [Aliifodinibius sp.]|nr:hypothetical protein [Fodinibius sp.]NIY25475.1 hypothetical protein [Fodinibius sp.]